MRRAVLAVAAIAALASSARAGEIPEAVRRMLADPDPEVRCDGLKSLKGRVDEDAAKAVVPFLDDRDPYCRDYASWMLVARATDPAAVKWIVEKAPRASSPAGRLAAADALAAMGSAVGGKAFVPALLRLAQDRDPRVRETALDALGRTAGVLADPAAGQRIPAALADPAPGPRAAALEALVALGDPSAPAAAARAAEDPDPQVRSAAVPIVARLAPAEVAAAFDRLASDPDWGVRLAAVRTVPSLPDPPPVEALASLLEDSRMRVADAAHDALREISGLDLPPVRGDWLDWWGRTRGAWKGRNRRPMGEAPRTSAAVYHGLRFRSNALLFVVDLSGSMDQPLGAVEPRPRIAVAKEELARTLYALPDGTAADLLAFMLEPARALGRLQPLGGGNRERIQKWFEKRERGRRGDLNGALAAALGDPDADTVLLLGDGGATAGDCVFRERILERVRQGLRLRPKAIHCVAFGSRPTDRQFLEEIASRAGGLCVER